MARKTQQEMDELLAQRGGDALVHGIAAQRTIKNPKYNPDDFRSDEPEHLTLDVQQWKSPGGHTIQAVQMPDGSWDVTQDEPATPKPATATSRQPVRKYPGTDPQTNLPAIVTEYESGPPSYDSSAPAASSATSTTAPRVPVGSVPRIEGTPIPGTDPVQYDNGQPVRAWHTPDGKVVYEALDAAERTQWERDRNGGRTDAERRTEQQAATGEVRKPVDGRPGWTSITRATAQGGNKTEVTVFVGPDGKEVPSLPEQAKDPTIQIVPINGQRYQVRTTPGRPGEAPRVEWFDPSGRPIAQPPAEVRPGQVIKGAGPAGEDVQAVTGPDGTISYQPIKGATPSAENLPISSDAPKYRADYDQDDLGLTAYNEQLLQWAGTGTPEQQTQRRRVARQLIEQAGALATQTASHGTTRRTQALNERNQDITQRSQDINEVQSRRSFAGSGYDQLFGDFMSSARYLGAGQADLAGRAFMDALGAREAYAARTGGYASVPRVPPPALSPPVQAVRTTTIHPDGTVQIAHPPAPAAQGAAVAPATQAAPQPAPADGAAPAGPAEGSSPAFRPPPPVPGSETPVGMVPEYLQPQGAAAQPAPQFDPTPLVDMWRQRGLSDDEIQEALAMSDEGQAA
jgi:hypothetical protein